MKALKLKPTREEEDRAAPPTGNIDAYDLYLKGRTAAHTGAVSSAVEFYEEAVQKDPRFALAYSGLADASMVMYSETSEGSWATMAMKAAQQAERLNDSLPEVHLSLGKAYQEVGKSPEALTEFKRVRQLSPNSDEPWRLLGTTYEDEGRKHEAIEALRKATEINPYSLIDQNELGTAYLAAGEYAKALDCFTQMLKTDPDNALAHKNLGATYFCMARYEESIVQYEEVLTREPDAVVYSNLGTDNFFLKRYPDAIKFSEKAVEMRPNDEQTVGNLADEYFWAGQKKKAMDTYDRAISLGSKRLDVNPKDAYVLGDLARYYAKKGEGQLAEYYITQARSDNPADLSLIYEEAQVLVATGRSKQAIPVVRSAFERGIPPQQAKLDPELSALQGNPDFQRLIEEFSRKSN